METDDKTTSLLDLPLERVVVDVALQPRVDGLDSGQVAALQECPDAWPRLVVVEHGGYLLVDGFHRLAAAQNLALETVRVEVREAPADGDLQALAFALNALHGRPLTLADRRSEAVRLLRRDPAVSNLRVARATALSPTTVAVLREQLEQEAAIPATEQRVSKSGVAYTPASSRRPGELPADQESLATIFTAKERREQRRLAHYFERLATALDDGFAFDNWQSSSDAAEACRVVLGEEAAARLAEELGPAARNVLDVAVALGYEDHPS